MSHNDVKPLVAPPHVIEVGGRCDVARGVFENQVGMALQLRLSLRVMLTADNYSEHLKFADQHRWAPSGILSDHVEHRIRQPAVIDAWHDQDDPALSYCHTTRQIQRHRVAECRAEAVEHTDRGMGVIDAWRECANGHLRQLADAKFEFSCADTLTTYGCSLDDCSSSPLCRRHN